MQTTRIGTGWPSLRLVDWSPSFVVYSDMIYPLRLTASLAACGLSLAALAPSALAAIVPDAPERPARINLQNDTPDLDDFILGPTRFLLPMQPGEERTVDVQLTNRYGESAIFDLLAEDFFADPEQQGNPSFFEANLDGPYPARLWLTPEYTRISLNHAERAYIKVTVKVPENAEPGDHQAALIVKQAAEGSSPSGINIVPRLASLFIITVDGDLEKEGSLVSLHPRKKLNWSLPVDMTLWGRNEGTVHFNANGIVEVRNIFGVTVDEIPVKNWIVLRDSSRSLGLRWSPRFALGRYTATTDLALFPDLPNAQLRTSFWVIPILPILVLLFTVFFVSFGVQYFFSRFEIKRKDDGEEKKSKKTKAGK